MQHVGTQTIETDRLILRRFTVDDAPAMFHNWAGDPQVTEYLIWQAYADVRGVAEYLRSVAEQYDNPTFYEWAIVLKETGEPIGSIGSYNLRESIEAIEVGYCIGRRWWGQGIVPEALRAVTAFLFRTVGANRIEAKHDVRNPASGVVMAKCGMTREGVLRQAARYNRGICDVCLYSILREEFFKISEQREACAP